MDHTTRRLRSQDPPEFLFRGNAVAAGGYLTKLNGAPVALDPQIVTVHGESSLPFIGGVSHSVIQQPVLPFAKFINYGTCETFVEGSTTGGTAVTTLRASVNNVRVMTSPSPEDQAPNLQSITFAAERLSIAVKSTHPAKGQPYFELTEEPEALGMSLLLTLPTGEPTTSPIRLEFDQPLIALRTMDDLDREFLQNRQFFDEHAHRFQPRKRLIFGKSKVPRTEQGYIFCSIVKRIFVGSDRPIEGNVLVQKGFGTIYFGTMLLDGYSRRISLVRIQMGSDPAGQVSLSGVETNGIWL